MEAVPLSVVPFLASLFCKSRVAKWVLVLSALPGLVSLIGMIAAFSLFASLGCTGSLLDQHVCPPDAIETARYAIMRPTVLAWLYGTFVAIGVAVVGSIIAVIAEVAKRAGTVE
jgi:hypothetical protein